MPFSLAGARPLTRRSLAALCLVAFTSASGAAELVVRIGGLTEPPGQVGCSLFASAGGFPVETGSARVTWVTADAKGATCRFTDVKEGNDALSIVHDLNGNKRVDTNVLGMPTEPWGVSNNVRHSLRAPRFQESSFKVAADASEVVIDITVAK
jgi:uncharacterized protein (DUF2141 family)